jgi:prevent-host-death family protein
MNIVSSADFHRNAGRYEEQAMTEPVIVTQNGEERLVVLSVVEYRRLKQRDRQALAVWELSDEDLALIVNGKMSEEHNHLNDELSE